MPYLLFVNFYSIFINFNSKIFLTDPSSVNTDFDTKLVRILRLLETKITLKLIKNFDSFVVLSPGLIKYYDLNPESCTIIPGFYNFNNVAYEFKYSSDTKFIISYAGSLSDKYGLPILDKLAGITNDSNFIVKVAGKVSENQKKNYPNIKFVCFLNGKNYTTFMNQSHLFINPRNPLDLFTNYSFPSKMFEYVSFKRPILSSDLSSIPKDFKDKIVTFENYNAEEIFNKILLIRDNYEYYSKQAIKLSEYCFHEYSEDSLYKKINLNK